ncbi:MAG TPA: MFS transporter [Ktedonobacteraceae bacterium]|nr:MFS transporter [Ktedonobacteraceae bacterium]
MEQLQDNNVVLSPVLTSDTPEALQASGTPEALQNPSKQVSRTFMFALTAAAISLYILYAGIGALLLPYQIGLLAPGSKVAILSFFTSITVLIALFANPLVGAFSDRTTSRFGRRRPWIILGGLLTALGLLFMWRANNIPLLFVGYCFVELFSNCVLATLVATIPDQVPEKQRGTVSGIFGLATGLGGILGAILAGQIFKSTPTTAYVVMLVIVLVTTIPFALFLKDKVLPKGYVPRFRLGAFLKNFWINPRKYPDFAWAWLTRFIPFIGYFLGITYIFYFLEDVVKYPHALQGASTFSIIAAAVSLLSTVLGGIFSDHLKRRKPFVIIGMIIMAMAMLLLALFQVWIAVVAAAAVLGFGLGAYLAVDVAIVTLVLPSAKNRAKDMGIINIANTLPHSIAPVIAGLLLAMTHSYSFLYFAATVFVLLGILTVLPIKSVR